MAVETVPERLTRLVKEAIARGVVRSEAQALKLAGLSSGYLAQMRNAVARGKARTLLVDTAQQFASVLQISVDEVLGGPPGIAQSASEREAAADAARLLQYPETAIATVLARPLVPGLTRLQWFEEIERAEKTPSADGTRSGGEIRRDSQSPR